MVEQLRTELADRRNALEAQSGAYRQLLEETAEAATAETDRGFRSFPSLEEIEQVRAKLEARGIHVAIGEVILASRHWTTTMSEQRRLRTTAIVIGILAWTAIEAVANFADYAWDHWMAKEPMTCFGISDAVLRGAASGAIGSVIGPMKLVKIMRGADEVTLTIKTTRWFKTYFWVGNKYWNLSTIVTLNQLAGVMGGYLGDLLVGNPLTKMVILDYCRAQADILASIRRGSVDGLFSTIREDMIANIDEAFGTQLLGMAEGCEADAAAYDVLPEDQHIGGTSLELTAASRENSAFLLTDTISWKAVVRVFQPGTYVANLKLYRAGTLKGTADTDTLSTSSGGVDLTFTGTMSASALYALAGSVPGEHQFRLDIVNNSQGWTEVASDNDGVLVWTFDLRPNVKPTVSLDTVGVAIVSYSVYYVDADGQPPTSVTLSVDGTVYPFAIPGSVDWTHGYTFTKNIGYQQAGIHSAQAVASDGTVVVNSGPPQEVRVGGVPYLVFPFVALDDVGTRALYTVTLRDQVGGLANRQIHLTTNRAGGFFAVDGTPIGLVTTGTNGSAQFYYIPMETGQHTLTVESFEAAPTSISQTSNSVVAACTPPGEFNLYKPSDGRSDVGESESLEWYTADGAGSYDIHFGTTPNPPVIANVPAETAFDQAYLVTGLQAGVEYYWYITARAECDPSESTSSAVRTFYTVTQPGVPTLVKPANGAVSQPTVLVLDWNNVTTPGDVYYDVYLGTANPPPFFQSAQLATELLVTNLLPNTLYYWQVYARSAEVPDLQTSSEIRTFTTGTSSAVPLTIYTTRDAGLRGGSFGNRNYGGSTSDAQHRYWGMGNDDNLYLDPGNAPIRGALWFDLSAVPADATIQSATLEARVSGMYGSQVGEVVVAVDALNGAWNEMSITWNNRPALNTSYHITRSLAEIAFFPMQIDVTNLAQAWHSGTVANNGVQLSIPAWETTPGFAKTFNQRETGAQSFIPRLNLVYTTPCPTIAAPALSSPADGATEIDGTVSLSWTSVTGSSSYRLYFGTASNPPEYRIVAGTSTEVTGLIGATTYYWKIEAISDCSANITATSATRTLSTKACLPPPQPALVAPVDGADLQPGSIAFTWNAVPGAAMYDLYFGSSNPPTTLVTTTSSTTASVLGLLPETTYYWKVVARASCDASYTAASPVRSLATAFAPHASAGADRDVAVGSTTVLGGSPAAFSGTPPYSYSWTLLTPHAVTISDLHVANPSFSSATAARHEIQLIVTDSAGFVSDPSTVFAESTCSPVSLTPAKFSVPSIFNDEILVNGACIHSGASAFFGSTAARSIRVPSGAKIALIPPTLPPGTLQNITVTNPDSSSAVLQNALMVDFSDVPATHVFHTFVESIVRAGITAGCGGGNYCPSNSVTRAQMAVFLLRAKHGVAYTPPPASGTVFIDVPISNPFAAWIEALVTEGITAGCGGGLYCPNSSVTRAQMAVFLLVAKEGSGYTPPAAIGIFGDVPVSSGFAPWIEELARRGITGGCGGGNYCPTSPNTRGQMAVFLKTTFGLP